MTRQSFEIAREVDEPFCLIALLIDASKILRFCQCAIERDAELRRHSLRHTIDARIRHFESATDIADRALRRHCAESDDLRHVISPIAAFHIVDDLLAADVAEIDIDIRHRHTFRVQESLKKKFILQGIEVRDAQKIGDNTARR